MTRVCKNCKSETNVKNGIVRGEQRYRCKGCGLNFIEGDKRKRQTTAVKKALSVLLYSLGKTSFSMLGRILGHSPSLIYRWIVEAMEAKPEPVIDGEIKEIEFDEMWHFIQKKAKTLDHQGRGSSHRENCCLGYRYAATFSRFYDKVKHLKDCLFYTSPPDVISRTF